MDFLPPRFGHDCGSHRSGSFEAAALRQDPVGGVFVESIEDPYTLPAGMSDEDSVTLALARDAELDSGEVSPVSHSELMARLRG